MMKMKLPALLCSCLLAPLFVLGFPCTHNHGAKATFVGLCKQSTYRETNNVYAHELKRRRSSIILQTTSTNDASDEVAAVPSRTTLISTAGTESGNSSSKKQQNHPLPRTTGLVGVIFDMDGTLTKPCIDFAGVRRRIYKIADADPFIVNSSSNIFETCSVDNDEGGRGCVLEIASQLSPEGQKLAKTVFDDIEAKALRDMEFADGVKELCDFLDKQGIQRAVLTRNVEASLEAMHTKLENDLGVDGGRFAPAVARDTVETATMETIPMKPNPDAILYICNKWNCHPMDVIMVGDSATDDIAAAYRAGCGGRVLINTGADNDSGFGGPQNEDEVTERTPHVTVKSLRELLELLQDS